MQLLGLYQSNITKWYYDELISLVDSAINTGGYSGGFTFKPSDAITQSNDFTSLTVPATNSRSVDEDLNNPLNILIARFNAVATEINDFNAKITILIDILNKDTLLLDQLIYAANLQVWAASIPTVFNATTFIWSFGSGFGKVGFNLPSSDPQNSVIYNSNARLGNYYSLTSSVSNFGLFPAVNSSQYVPKNLTWVYDSLGFDEVSYGTDWAELNFLESNILLNFNTPQIDVLLPNNNVNPPFQVRGISTTKGIPIYVRTKFNPRFSKVSVNSGINVFPAASTVNILPGDQVHIKCAVRASAGTNGSCSLFLNYYDSNNVLVVDSLGNAIKTLVGSLTAAGTIEKLVTTSFHSNIASLKLSLVQNNVTVGAYTLDTTATINTPIRLTNGYSIDQTSVDVISDSTYYSINQDFSVTGNGYVTFINVPDQTNVSIVFTEYYPCYQCSVNQTVWSPIIMFDYLRPYADTETLFAPLPIGVDSNGVRDLLPIVDESGVASGLYIKLTGIMSGEYLLKVYQDADASTAGKQATLVMDFGQPRFVNVLNLSSYTNFPIIIQSINIQGFTSNTEQNIFTGALRINKPTSITFPTTLVSIVTITFVQENYSIKQHQIVPDDYLRRKAINDLQAVIPPAAQESNILPKVVFADGYQYEFGVEYISLANETAILPTVFVAGPYNKVGKSSSITINAQTTGNVSFYVCYNAFDSNNLLIGSNTVGVPIILGSSIPFPFNSGALLNNINSQDIYIKVVFRDSLSNIENLMVQVD